MYEGFDRDVQAIGDGDAAMWRFVCRTADEIGFTRAEVFRAAWAARDQMAYEAELDESGSESTASAPGCMVLLALGGALAGLLELAHVALTMIA